MMPLDSALRRASEIARLNCAVFHVVALGNEGFILPTPKTDVQEEGVRLVLRDAVRARLMAGVSMFDAMWACCPNGDTVRCTTSMHCVKTPMQGSA